MGVPLAEEATPSPETAPQICVPGGPPPLKPLKEECPWATQLQVGVVGTIDFCHSLEEAVALLKPLGAAIISWLDDTSNSIMAWCRKESTMDPRRFNEVPIAEILPWFLNNVAAWVLKLTEWHLKRLREFMCTILYGPVRPAACDPATYIGVQAARWIWNTATQAEIGFDFVVDLKLKIGDAAPLVDRMLDWLLRYICQDEMPGVPEAIEIYLRGDITTELFDCWVKCNGLAPDVADMMVYARRERPSWEQYIEFALRTDDPLNVLPAKLRGGGIIDTYDVEVLKELYFELPTIQDHLEWLRRNVDDADYVQRFGLLDGFSTDAVIQSIPEYAKYTTTSDTFGRDFWKAFGHDLTAQGMRIQYAAKHYAAHWIQPAPTQMREFLYRLRPDKDGVKAPFTEEDYKRLLIEQDVAPWMIARWVETAHPVPALGYIRDMYRMNVIDTVQLISYHKDLGYTQTDSEHFAGVDAVMKARMRTSQSGGYIPLQIGRAFVQGRMSMDEVYARMDALGWTEREADDMVSRAQSQLAYTIFTRSRSRWLSASIKTVQDSVTMGAVSPADAVTYLTGLGWRSDYATSTVTAWQAQFSIDRLKETVKAVRTAFMGGEVDAAGVVTLLQGLGLDLARSQGYLNVWALQRSASVKRRSASQVMDDLSRGLISPAAATARLINLNVAQPDLVLWLADAKRKSDTIQQKAATAAHKADMASQKALAKAATDAEKLRKESLKRLERVAPVSVLQKWAALGVIGQDWFLERLRLYGYPADVAAGYYEQACAGKGAACVSSTPEGPLTTAFPAGETGTTSVTGEPGP